MVRFLIEEKKIAKIAIWGRSMGAATAAMYLSDGFRKEISRLITLQPEIHDIFYSTVGFNRP